MIFSDKVAPKVFAVSFIALIFIFYGFVAWRRKARFRSLASKLNATYTDMGCFAPGKITGNDFDINVYTAGVGRSRRYFTTLKVSAPKAPSTYLLKAPFFEKYPDWKFVKVLGTASERVFVTTISVPRYLELSPEQQDRLLSWLGHSSISFKEFHQVLKKNRINELVLSETSLMTTFKGVVSNLDRLRGSLNALRLLAH